MRKQCLEYRKQSWCRQIENEKNKSSVTGCQLKGRNGLTVNTVIIKNVSDAGKRQE